MVAPPAKHSMEPELHHHYSMTQGLYNSLDASGENNTTALNRTGQHAPASKEKTESSGRFESLEPGHGPAPGVMEDRHVTQPPTIEQYRQP